MGAWGTDSFQNDAAGDWADTCIRAQDLSVVEATLAKTLADDELDADDACEALAACEVVARLQGRWGCRDAYSEALDVWIMAQAQQPSAELVTRAVDVIDKVVADGSELASLWEASDDEWRADVANLRARVLG